MSLINRLSEETAGKIAAGEIIERPQNVVKELVENSLDAGSNRLILQVEKGGKSLIQLIDNGSGIPADEIPLATENYSTSKISNSEDMERIETLGFRGEALASIKAVSRLTIQSMGESDETGREISWEGLKLIYDKPVARKRGATVTVEDLFFNLPARRNFLSRDSTELRRIISLMHKFGMAFPEVGMKVSAGGDTLLELSPSSLSERTEAVFGRGNFERMRYFDFRDGELKISGYASTPDITRGNRSMQFIFVNGRFVRDRLISNALGRAYESVIPSGRFPMAVLFLQIPSELVDANIHPSKAEVRFLNGKEVHRLVYSAVRENTRFGKTISFKEKVESVYRSIFPETAKGDKASSGPEKSGHQFSMIENMGTSETAEEGSEPVIRESPEPLFNEGGKTEGLQKSSALYWQLHDSYILIQIRGGMVVIDQHAAHERILYNRARKNMAGNKPAIQSLLFPATVELSPAEFEIFDEHREIMPQLGFEAEPFGMRTIIVRGIPAGVKNWNDGALLKDIFAEKGRGKTELEEILKRYACHSAIRAGEKLEPREMESLVDQLFATDFPFTCPHGRPTMLRVNLDELDRRFHRPASTEKK